MTLKQLIRTLKAGPQDKVIRWGFGAPMSWRGIYAELAFEPVENVTVAEMLRHAESAVGKTFEGYKGGEFKMDESTNVHIAEYGYGNDLLGEFFLRNSLGT